MAEQHEIEYEPIVTLPEEAPVEMPDLPTRLVVNTSQQFKAFGDPLRSRILSVIQFQPATAKQIADKLNIPPGTIGHHLQVLEDAGLVQVVARRLVRSIVAKYYTRTARIFMFDFSYEVAEDMAMSLNIITHARDELADAFMSIGEEASLLASFPHARLSPERAKEYQQRLNNLIDEFLEEATDPAGTVYGLCSTLFIAPVYMQTTVLPPSS